VDTDTSNTQYKQVTVDVPEDRLADFYMFFGRFLAAPTGRGRGGRHGRPHRGPRGHRCDPHRESSEPTSETSAQPAASTEGG